MAAELLLPATTTDLLSRFLPAFLNTILVPAKSTQLQKGEDYKYWGWELQVFAEPGSRLLG